MRVFIIISIVVQFFGAASWGARDPVVIRLFNGEGIQVDTYDALLDRMQKGDVLAFNDGARFQFIEELGRGTTTQIIKVKPQFLLKDSKGKIVEEIALRLPLRHDMHPANGMRVPTRFINMSIEDYPKLVDEGVPVPKPYRFLKDQYIAVELMHPKYDLEDIFLKGHEFSPDEQQKILKALDRFSSKTAHFKRFSDFHLRQLVYDSIKEDFILMDFSEGSKVMRPMNVGSVRLPQRDVYGRLWRAGLFYENLTKRGVPYFNSFQKQVIGATRGAVVRARSKMHFPCILKVLHAL